MRELFEKDPALKSDPRFALYPQWLQRRVAQGNYSFAVDPRGGSGKMVLDVMRAGGLVVAGTDTPNAINLHGEIKLDKLIGLAFAVILGTATVGIAAAQQKLFAQSCSTVSFNVPHGSALGRSAAVLLAPCPHHAGQ